MRYHRLSVLSVLTVAPLAGLASPPASHWVDMLVKHAWEAAPSNWESFGTPLPGTTMDLQVAIKPDNENALIDALYEVSTLRNIKYALSDTSPRTMYLCVPLLRCRYGPVSQANELLGASYQLYRYVGTNDTVILRTVSHSLHRVLHRHVQRLCRRHSSPPRARCSRYHMWTLLEQLGRRRRRNRESSCRAAIRLNLRWLRRNSCSGCTRHTRMSPKRLPRISSECGIQRRVPES